MNADSHGSTRKRSAEDEALSGFALSLLVAVFCVCLGGGPIWLLAPLALVPLVWFLPWCRRARPPRALIAAWRLLVLLAAGVWLASIVVSITVRVSSSEAWVFGMGHLEHVRYRRVAPYSTSPKVTIGLGSVSDLHSAVLHSVIGGGRQMAHGFGFSSITDSWATLPPVICVLMPTWVLQRLRQARIPPHRCPKCKYDLTGNISGQCPECGEPTDHEADL